MLLSRVSSSRYWGIILALGWKSTFYPSAIECSHVSRTQSHRQCLLPTMNWSKNYLINGDNDFNLQCDGDISFDLQNLHSPQAGGVAVFANEMDFISTMQSKKLASAPWTKKRASNQADPSSANIISRDTPAPSSWHWFSRKAPKVRQQHRFPELPFPDFFHLNRDDYTEMNGLESSLGQIEFDETVFASTIGWLKSSSLLWILDLSHVRCGNAES